MTDTNNTNFSLGEPAPALEIPNRFPIVEIQIKNGDNKKINLIKLFVGMIFIWLTYGFGSVAGNSIMKNTTARGFQILFWLSLSRFIGDIVVIFILYIFDPKPKQKITISKTSLVAMCMPLVGNIGCN